MSGVLEHPREKLVDDCNKKLAKNYGQKSLISEKQFAQPSYIFDKYFNFFDNPLNEQEIEN